jgi:hypothetical protein
MNLSLKDLITKLHSLHTFDNYNNEEIYSNLDIPTSFKNLNWYIEHTCKKCQSKVEYNNSSQNSTYIAGTELWYQKLPNKDFLEPIGQLFGLTLHDEVDSNKKIIYYYYDHIKSNLPAWFIYYKCKYCESQYMLCYSTTFGAERKNEPDMTHLRSIYQVEFNENEFLELYHKYFNF